MWRLGEELGNIIQENTTTDILVEDRLWPPVAIIDQEREQHKPNS